MRPLHKYSALIACALYGNHDRSPTPPPHTPRTTCEHKPTDTCAHNNNQASVTHTPAYPNQEQYHFLHQMKWIERMQAQLTQCPDSSSPILCIECNPLATYRAPEARRHPRIFCEASWLYETTLDFILTDTIIPHSSDTMNKIQKLINSEKNTDANADIIARTLHQILNTHLFCHKEKHNRSSNTTAQPVNVMLLELCVDLLSPSHLCRPSIHQVKERLNDIQLAVKNNPLLIKKIKNNRHKTVVINRRNPAQPRLIRTCLKPEGCATSTDFLKSVYCPMHDGKYTAVSTNRWRSIETVFYDTRNNRQANHCLNDRIHLAKSLTQALNTLGQDYVFIDVKLQNFIQTQAGQYYFIDPDSVADNHLTIHNLKTSRLCYDARYAAPEYLNYPGTFSKKSTVYQLALAWIEAGCIIHPYQGEHQAFIDILHGDQDIDIDLTKQEALVNYLDTFIDTYLTDPRNPSCIAYHRLLQLCRSMLSIEPSRRPTLDNIEQQLSDIQKSYDTQTTVTSMQIPRPTR